MITMNTAMIARGGAIALIGRRAEKRCTTPLRTQDDVGAIMNEVALALFEEASRRERRGWRWVRNRLARVWRRLRPPPIAEDVEPEIAIINARLIAHLTAGRGGERCAWGAETSGHCASRSTSGLFFCARHAAAIAASVAVDRDVAVAWHRLQAELAPYRANVEPPDATSQRPAR